jgi:glycerophosphoryl diester phosphodiesterase
MRATQPLFIAVAASILMLGGTVACAGDGKTSSASADEPIVIGHRGASGYLPEHTLAAYFVAIQQGADYIEPDLVMTRDGVLVARHENAIAIVDEETGGIAEATTDVADHPEFADRKTTKVIDGQSITGWFTEDFTLAELKTLRARERLPQLRAANTRFDGQFEVPSFEEVLNLVDAVNRARARDARRQDRPAPKPVGIYPETKHPTYFNGLGLSMEKPLVKALRRFGYASRTSPVFIQSFEVGNLKDLRKVTRVRLIQLLDASGKPWDFVVNNDPRTYADLAKPEGLAEIAGYADGIGANKSLIIPRRADGSLGAPSTLAADAHKAGLTVHGWTFRAENAFLPTEYKTSPDPADAADFGNLEGEIRAFLQAGMDGFFTDHPDRGDKARDAFLGGR